MQKSSYDTELMENVFISGSWGFKPRYSKLLSETFCLSVIVLWLYTEADLESLADCFSSVSKECGLTINMLKMQLLDQFALCSQVADTYILLNYFHLYHLFPNLNKSKFSQLQGLFHFPRCHSSFSSFLQFLCQNKLFSIPYSWHFVWYMGISQDSSYRKTDMHAGSI